VNNLVLTVAVVGAANLWAQSGMKACDAAILGAGLTVYDFVATSLLGLMDQLLQRLAGLRFAPLVAWEASDGAWLGVGLGDLLLATVFPLVTRKAFGASAGRTALGVSLGVIGVLLGVVDLGLVRVTIPVMVVLGPLMLLQYAWWKNHARTERTMWQYLQTEMRRGEQMR
jgi:hypothetical protein